MKQIYLDNASTTRVRPAVAKAMQEIMLKNYGNPSSSHALGEEALHLITQARTTLATSLHARPAELVFTSGATESNALALFGLAGRYPAKKKLIISAFEHSSIVAVCEMLRQWSYEIVEIPVNHEGMLDLHALEQELTADTLVVSVIHGHNELGVVQDIKQIARLCKEKRVFFHTDAVQSFGKVKIDVRWGIDLLSISAHKLQGPKGVGALYVRTGIALKPLLPGSQEAGRRGGTENMPGIVGFGKAVTLLKKNHTKIVRLQQTFERALAGLGGIITCTKSIRLPGHTHVSFPDTDAEQVAIALSLKGVYCSTRSACLTHQSHDNRVLQAMGMSASLQKGSLRFVLSDEITQADLQKVIALLKELLHV